MSARHFKTPDSGASADDGGFGPGPRPRHRALRLALLFLVVFSIFFGGSLLFMRLTRPQARAVEPDQPKPTIAQPVEEGSGASPAASAREERIDLAFIGSVLVTQSVWEGGEASDGTRSYGHLFAQVADDLAAADFAIVQQQTVLGGTELGLSGWPAYNSPQEIGDAEVAAGIDAVACASELAQDKGLAGLAASLGYWASAHPDVAVVGASVEGGGGEYVALLEKGSFKVALLDFTADLGGDENEGGAVRLLTEDNVRADAAEAEARGADLTVAVVHWAENGATEVLPSQRAWAELLAGCGVDVLLGVQPYVIQPVETVSAPEGECLVFWSAGAFTSTFPAAENLVGGLVTVGLAKDAAGARVASYAFEPTVAQRGTGTAQTTYKLADYTEALAQRNRLRDGDEAPALAWYRSFASIVLGDAYDAASCRLHAELG